MLPMNRWTRWLLGFLAGVAGLAGCATAPARTDPASDLSALVNRYRAAPSPCPGRDAAPLPALVPDPALARVEFAAGAALTAALDRAGYLSARAQAIALGGAADAAAAMAVLRERFCAVLLDPGFSRIAVGHPARGQWRVLLAQPLRAADLGSTREAGRDVLARINTARSQARQCGGRRYAAAPALRWSEALAGIALGHSADMARHDYFDHRGRDGAEVAQRASRAGYRWQRIGENIAAGQGDDAQAVAGWVASPGHCANLMNPGFTEMGAAYAVDGASRGKIYWTQVLGTPR